MKLTHTLSRLGCSLALAVVGAACDAPVDGASANASLVELLGPPVTAQALDALCSADVEGIGLVPVESDYLPHVIACENGAASFEALKAQAVAARSYLYYKANAYPGTPIQDGQGDQVYTCQNQPSAIHFEAVAATSGEILRYENTYVAAFYVAGAVPTEQGCVAIAGDNDYSSTEHYVTYNWGRRAGAVDQTNLGWVNAGNYANRGCQSQNGADCLSDAGWDYEDILRFFYGVDIDLVQSDGECVAVTPSAHGCGAHVDGEAVVIDDADACFLVGCETDQALLEVNVGAGGASVLTASVTGEADCVGRWRMSFAAAGEHRVRVHLPDVAGLNAPHVYKIRHAGMDSEVTVVPAGPGWVDLGTFFFDEGRHQWVELGDSAEQAGDTTSGPFIAFDAVAVGPVGGAFPGDGPDAGTGDAGSATPPGDAGDKDAGQSGEPGDGDAGTGGALDHEADAGVYDELPPSVQECACTAVPGRPPWWTFSGLVAALLIQSRIRRRR